jgi:hypothetical protein
VIIGAWNRAPLSFALQSNASRLLIDEVLNVNAGLHQLAIKRLTHSRGHYLSYSVLYCTVWITEPELLAMFESP